MRVVFWGSPEFAVAVLDALLESRHEIVGVVTRPSRPTGRGRRLRPTPVARRAEAAGLPVLAPRRPRGDAFLAELAALAPDVSVVAAYGAILPPEILTLPPHGSLNVHASLLPEYRGAAPVTRALLDGRAETGITIMRMEPGLDTGPVCLLERMPVAPGDSAGSLTARLAGLGGRAAVEALDRLEAGGLDAVPQDERLATWAEKVSTDEARIDWRRGAAEIERATRAFDPWPGAWTTFRGERLKVFRVAIVRAPAMASDEAGTGESPGELVATAPAPIVQVGDGAVALERLQAPGGRPMTGAEWARGRGVRAGERLGAEG